MGNLVPRTLIDALKLTLTDSATMVKVGDSNIELHSGFESLSNWINIICP